MKKLRLTIFTLIAFCLMAMPTSARKITSLEELGSIIENIEPDAYSAYIIGKYVFTNENGRLSTQDIMAGASSIGYSGKPNKEEMYKKMTIYTIENTTEWKIRDNLIGKENGNLVISEEKPLEIESIDYNYVAEESKVNSFSNEVTNYKKNYLNKILIIKITMKIYNLLK